MKKSGENKTIFPFNPKVFVDELNKQNGFTENDSLIYSVMSDIVPNFQYVDIIVLRGKSETEKLELIMQYFNNCYYLAVEVKGVTNGNQHWVALNNVASNDIVMIDYASN